MSLVMGLVKASIFIGIFAMGLRATVREVTWLFRHPALLASSFLSLNVVTPLAAVAIALTFDLHPSIRLALVTFAVSPVVHMYAAKTLKAGGRDSFVVSLFVLSTLASVILIPLTASLLHRFLGTGLVAPSVLVATIGTGVMLPLVAGMILRAIAPGLAGSVAAPLEKLATLLLLAGFIPLLIKVHRPMFSLVGDGTLVAITGYALFSMLVGHLAGGADAANRTVLMIASVSRHPAMAIAVARAANPDEPRVGAAVLLLALVNAVITAIYAARQKKRSAHAQHVLAHDAPESHVAR